jgi:hypothetical protein
MQLGKGGEKLASSETQRHPLRIPRLFGDSETQDFVARMLLPLYAILNMYGTWHV